MRTCISDLVRLHAEDLRPSDFTGCKQKGWLYASGYCLYTPGLLQRAIELAQEVCTLCLLWVPADHTLLAHTYPVTVCLYCCHPWLPCLLISCTVLRHTGQGQ